MNVQANCRARCSSRWIPADPHDTGAEFVVLAKVAVDEVRQYQDHDRARQELAYLQPAVVDHLLGRVGLHREHRHVLLGLADFTGMVSTVPAMVCCEAVIGS